MRAAERFPDGCILGAAADLWSKQGSRRILASIAGAVSAPAWPVIAAVAAATGVIRAIWLAMRRSPSGRYRCARDVRKGHFADHDLPRIECSLMAGAAHSRTTLAAAIEKFDTRIEWPLCGTTANRQSRPQAVADSRQQPGGRLSAVPHVPASGCLHNFDHHVSRALAVQRLHIRGQRGGRHHRRQGAAGRWEECEGQRPPHRGPSARLDR